MAIVTDLEALNREVTDIMLRHYGDRLAKIILYGSYARGDFHDGSDVDYLVLLDDENVSAFNEVATTAADRNAYYLEHFIHISAFVASQSQFLTSNRLFYREVKKDGKPVYERRPKSVHQESRRVSGERQNSSSYRVS
ncbi:MAG: nucleotidyltransferase domain-containing protein [Rudanella sp.]|nr:nucleotidyltransferase domain-containing protein [Rudanella sp.]